MNFSHFNRRLHLYLAMSLLPWFLMYGFSSIPFSHAAYFESLDKAKGIPLWTLRFEKQPYEVEIPAGTELRPVGEKILRDAGLQGAFGVYRQSANQLNVYLYSFFRSTQLKYFINEKKLVAEDRRFRWDHFLTGMHAKGGFEQGGWHNVWGVVVDLACFGMLLWVVTGVYMWWKLPATRFWGWVAMLSGIGVFGLFLWLL